jgi:hypothetical protein
MLLCMGEQTDQSLKLSLMVCGKPCQRAVQPLAQRHLGLPTKALQYGYVAHLTRRAIRLGCIPNDGSAPPKFVANQIRERRDGYFFIRQVVHEQKLLQRPARSPARHSFRLLELGPVNSSHDAWDHVRPRSHSDHRCSSAGRRSHPIHTVSCRPDTI